MAEQDALLDYLLALTEQTSHAVLASRSVLGVSERSGVVWNAWHAVRMSYRSPLSPSRLQGVDTVPGFDAQVRGEIRLFSGRRLLFVSCSLLFMVLGCRGEVMCTSIASIV